MQQYIGRWWIGGRKISEKDQGLIEDVFDELYPPSCMEDIRIKYTV